MIRLALLCFSSSLLLTTRCQDAPIREVEQGLVQGFYYNFNESRFTGIDTDLDIFYSIPFAEPPVDDLRFRPPVTKSKWDGIYDATGRSAACFQENPATLYLRKSEDCLYLSVYAPRPKPTGAAVMVFFHGGGFSFGSAMQYEYDGAPLTAVGDIIYVGVNYRLNVFGYMSTGDEAAPGNYGMLDQVESLKWVQQNIEAFGGDPNRVTIFGESAGAASSSFHLLSKGSHDLFNQVILESGASTSDWAFTEIEKARQQALDIGKECGCDISNTMDMLECLRSKRTQTVFDAGVAAGLFGGAVVDGVFLEDLPINLLERGEFKNVNIMMGTNQDEGAIYAIAVYPNYILADDPPHMNRTDFLREVPRFMSEDNPVFLDAMYQEYSPWDEVDKPGADYLRGFIDINTDPTFACPTDQVARAHASAGDRVYVYQMTRDPSASLLSVGPLGPGWTGAAHSEELQFVFGSPFMERNLHGELNDDDKALTVEFMKYWTNFAKTGDPNQDELAEWPLFTLPEMEYLMLDLNSTVGRALKAKPCAFWNDYMVKLRTFAGNLPQVESEWRNEFYSWKHVDMVEWREEFEDYKQVTGQCDKDGCK